MLTNYADNKTDSRCRNGRESDNKKDKDCKRNGHHHYKLRPEWELIWDCLTWCIPSPIKNSCLIPRKQINNFIHEFKK